MYGVMRALLYFFGQAVIRNRFSVFRAEYGVLLELLYILAKRLFANSSQYSVMFALLDLSLRICKRFSCNCLDNTEWVKSHRSYLGALYSVTRLVRDTEYRDWYTAQAQSTP